MEFNKELYQRALSRVKASPEKIQEVIDMTESKRPKLARRLLTAALIAALLSLVALGANAAMGGEVFSRVIGFSAAPEKSDLGQRYLVRMENSFREASDILAKRLEYDPSAGLLKIWLDDIHGEEVWVALAVGKNVKAYSSFAEMEADTPITGTTEDGQEFTVEKRP